MELYWINVIVGLELGSFIDILDVKVNADDFWMFCFVCTAQKEKSFKLKSICIQEKTPSCSTKLTIVHLKKRSKNAKLIE